MVSKQPKTIISKFVNWYQNLWIPTMKKPPRNFISLIGDPVLRAKSVKVELDKINSQEIKNVVNKMKSVMKKANAMGLAAPQIGCPLRIIAIQFTEKMLSQYPPVIVKAREMKLIPFKVFINPELLVINKSKVAFPESCASVGSYSGSVSRFLEVKLSGYDENGTHITWQTSGWPARIVQHEMDHLNGLLFVDFMDPKTFIYEHWFYDNVKSSRYFVRLRPRKYQH